MPFTKDSLTLSSTGNIVAVLDIGSSKIVCLIANINNGKVHVLGSGCHSANGFKNGNITNSKSAKFSIISAVDQAEKAAGVTIDKVVLALNGNKIHSHYLHPSTELRKNKVNERDIAHLISKGLKELEKQEYEVIHYFPLEYIIDDNNGILDPTGLLGHKLSAKIHFVTIASSMLDNIINCLASCQLDVEDCIFAPYAAGLATLNDIDKEIGSTVIDFGSGITSYAIFSQHHMVYCGFIPIGSGAITHDIAKSFMLDFATAERIKTIHGSANIYSADHQMVNYKFDTQADNEERNILKSELNNVINARLEEILIILRNVLIQQNSLFPNAKNNIIITGGGSLLTGISEEVTKLFGSKVKLGKTINFPGLNAESANASYATSIGVLQYLLNRNNNTASAHLVKPSLIGRTINWLKDNF